MEYQIELTWEARADLYYYSAFERKIIVSAIRAQLTNLPLIETKNRKKLRDNPFTSWEMRLGKYRVFYEADKASRKVTIVGVGHKEHTKESVVKTTPSSTYSSCPRRRASRKARITLDSRFHGNDHYGEQLSCCFPNYGLLSNVLFVRGEEVRI